MDAYIESWKLGLKAVAIYRDNSKKVQPLSSASGKTEKKPRRRCGGGAGARRWCIARCGASCRTSAASITHKFSIGGHEGYITVGMYEDGDAGRDLHHHGEGRLHDLRTDGRFRHRREFQPAIRRAR